ncbi:hypothetical protein Amme_005_050 [Acidomonas methanolica NBRC 104435]|uniref:Uncharacterized protein n=1 Tax=Acidomonas methanolica NBRC 104435 TaxID=1231351 RepID=A0A023D0K9_ACIMT|nr:hypothetical protein Amme_005_050 [Acidomonas methanolica NBRC 104435]GEK97724.1 hypothetical protein AME01nite_02230 [Acidomonas methanolica NBRC 104435]
MQAQIGPGVPERREFRLRFLHPVLPECRLPRGQNGGDGFGGMEFADGDEGDPGRVASRLSGGGGDTLPDSLKSAPKAGSKIGSGH